MHKILNFTILIFTAAILPNSCAISQAVPESKISDSPTTIEGFNHIGISVYDLEEMITFYESATEFELVKREKVSNSKNADALFGIQDISYEVATFKGPNMLLELTQFANQKTKPNSKMAPEGPGMTHTCYQSPEWISGYDKFKNNGAAVLSRGDGPVDLGGYGVTYAYAYDPDGNMMELEQLTASRILMDSLWLESNPMWMTQVALISPDVERLGAFYEKVLSIPPARKGAFKNLSRLDDIIDSDSTSILAIWFTMDGLGKMLELMQYINPETSSKPFKKHPTDLGYSFSMEVTDIQKEYQRLKQLDVHFLSEPKILGEFWIVYANDIDGNVFSLRQPTSPESTYSVVNIISKNGIQSK